ncbi:MAG: carbohydrate kinase family protein [Candidatus Roizmanbacteria bacterium]
MYDIIVIGNISVDLYFKGKSLTKDKDRFQLAIGGKYFADEFYEDIGGGGCNVAAGLAKKGYKVAVFGKIGNNPFKNIILKKLESKNISSESCQFQDNYYKISAILLTESGERTIINYETPANLWQEFTLNEQIKIANNVYIGPLPRISLEEKNKIVSHFKGPEVLTIVNLADNDCRRPVEELTTIFEGLDILIVNTHEFSDLLKKKYQEMDFKNLLIELPILKEKTVVVTDAEKGSYGYFNNEIYYQQAIIPEEIVDTTGAGDGYTAGFIAEYLKTKDIKKSMESGAKYASEVLTKIGAN